jgi:hypothetical protein
MVNPGSMRGRSAWPVRTAAVGPVAVGAVLWRLGGQLMATFIVKTTFAFEPGGPMKIVDPEPLRLDDEHLGGHPMRSLVGACEVAPMLRAVDVVLTGHAYPAAGEAQTEVRLGLGGAAAGLLFEKKLLVRGDRDAAGVARPFERMPLVWERSFGGIGHVQNPIGVGVGETNKREPNVTHLDAPGTAGFGPIPATFPLRRKLLGQTTRKSVMEGVADIPIGFDWSYFQSAPEDQRVRSLPADTWILLEGAHARERRLRMRLPGATALAKVYGHDAAGVPDVVPLKADMLHIDADAERCTLVSRGSFPIQRPEALGDIVVAGTLELPDEPAIWPESVSDLEEEPYAAPPPAGGSETLAFEGAVAGAFGTDALGPEQIAALMAKETGESPLTGTVALSEEQLSKAGQPLPFAGGAPKTQRKTKAIVPGAPWEKETPVRPVEKPHGKTTAEILTRTQEREAEARRAAAEALENEEAQRRAAGERAAREAAEAEARRAAEAERFAKEQEDAKRQAELRAAEEADKRRDESKKLRDDLYGGFKRKR